MHGSCSNCNVSRQVATSAYGTMPDKGFSCWTAGLIRTALAALLMLSTATANEIKPVTDSPFLLIGDPASQMVSGIDRFLLKQTELTRQRRHEQWTQARQADWKTFVETQRKQFMEMLGIRGSRVIFNSLELVSTTTSSASVAESDQFRIQRVRWPVLPDPDPLRSELISVYGEGLLLSPNSETQTTIIAIPDADITPEQLCGLTNDLPLEQQYARRLAEAGCRVIVPGLTSRRLAPRLGRAVMTDREFIYRSAFVLGQHLIGYELQKVLALVDMLHAADRNSAVGMVGYGEGGMLTLYASAIDPRIQSAAVSGFFGPRDGAWREPLSRNVFGLLNHFGAAELAAAMSPRPLTVETSTMPKVRLKSSGGAPAALSTPTEDAVRQEARMATSLGAQLSLIMPEDKRFGSTDWLHAFLSTLPDKPKLPSASSQLNVTSVDIAEFTEARRVRQLQQLDRHNQALLRESPFVRKEFLSKLSTDSVEAFKTSQEPYRDHFRYNTIGQFDLELVEPGSRSRQRMNSDNWAVWDSERLLETDAWTAWEIWLEVFPDVSAYGVLLLPKDLKPDERRPVVVCQHGLEGRPVHTIAKDHPAYHNYAAKLCEQGFITFSPQNIYIFKDRFRTLQRKANPLGKTLFSIMVPQHQQIVNWLKSQPFVDGDHIAFYGLSYGGKSAMRIPALVTDYCLSICSADFNEWVLKNVSTRHNFSYVWTGEYEIFEWNLGRTFNYFEMASLICPRPFMVERGHFDGVGEDNWVAHEYAKIRHLYAAKLKIPERTEIEWFVGPHTINGQRTFEFLQRHLKP